MDRRRGRPGCPGRRPARRRTSAQQHRRSPASAPDPLGGAPDEALDPPVGRRRLVQRGVGELDRRAVVRRDEVVAQLDRADPLHDLVDQRGVAQRLAHLLAAEGDPAVVQPVAGEAVAGRPRLGLLVLVVREAQVQAAAVDVELGAEVAARPSPSTPGASPAGRGPRASARRRSPARRPCAPSTARSRAGRACGRRCRCRRPAAGRRASGRSARRTRGRSARRSRRRRRRRRRARARSAAPSARSSRGRARWPAARRWAAGTPRTS